MNARKVRLGLLVLLLGLALPLAGVSAKGPFAKIVITGPGLAEPLEIIDAESLPELGTVELMDVYNPAEAPAEPGPAYALTRYGYEGRSDRYQAFDLVYYYPAAGDGSAYVYYDGIINGSSEYDGRWYPVTAVGDAALRELLAAHGVEVPGQPQPFKPHELYQHIWRMFHPA